MSQPERKSNSEILRDAEEYCHDNGLRLTQRRKDVLRLVSAAAAAVKAYDLLGALTAPGTKAMPPLVYRALDFWVEHGFVHRIESLNAFFACGHPLHNHGCQLLICSQCRRTVEVCDPNLREGFAQTARRHGFAFHRAVLEIHGSCPTCAH